jgi:hypothetical protein
MKNNKLVKICISLLAIGIINSCASSENSSMYNMVARMEVKEPIPGVCDNANVIAILPFPGNGQMKARAPKTNEEITQELNSKVSFLKDKPDYEDKGMVHLIINCKGELVKCETDNKTKSPELDSQIVAVFAELKMWTAGKINHHSVDTSVLYSFTIKNGKIILP